MPQTQRQKMGEPECEIRLSCSQILTLLLVNPNKPWYLTVKMRRDGTFVELGTRLKGFQTSCQPHESLMFNLGNVEKRLLNCLLLNIS